MAKTVRKGLLAGAVGTTVLNAITYGDMLVRGRGTSSMPERTVGELLDRAGVELPGGRSERGNRLTALGALSGTVAGLGVGLAGAAARDAGVRLPVVVESVALGAAAMAATDLPSAVLGVEDPRKWSRTDWIADAVPHLAFGAATAAALRASERNEAPKVKASPGLVVRSAVLGVATGLRSSLGATPVLTSATLGGRAKLAAVVPVIGELVGDKLPKTPDRTQSPGLPARAVAAAGGSLALSGRDQANAVLPVVAAVGGAVAASYGGLAWRRWAGSRVPDWQAALAEDAVAVVAAFAAARR